MTELSSVFVRIAVNLILIGTPISIGVFVVLRLTRAAAPRARYLLTVIAFFAAAVMPFVVTITPTQETPPHPTFVKNSNTESAEISNGPLKADIHELREMLPESQPDTAVGSLLDPVVRFISRPSLSIEVFTLWLAGAGLLLAREVASHVRVARARGQWKPASAELRERLAWPRDKRLFVDSEFGPCALGVLNPVVVIPARLFDELSITAARQIARHELDHLKWRDPLVYAAMRIVRASLWPSAPLWYLNRATRLEREAASDRAAVNSTSGTLQPDIAAAEYASTLVSIARRYARMEGRRKHAWVATEVGNESGLNDRVRRLMAISARLTGVRLSFALATVLISANSLVILPVARLESKHNENQAAEPAPQPIALGDPTRVEAGPAKAQSNRPARPATLDRRSLSEVDDGPQESTLAQTRPDAKVEDSESVSSIAASTATANANTIEPEQDHQLAVLQSQMAAVGYKDLTAKQLSDMRAYAVGPAYVAEMAESGYSGLSADMLIKFKWFAVSSPFIREMRALGYDNLSPRTLVSFRQHGVNAEYIRQMRSRISGPISPEQMDLLRFHGTSTEFVDKLKAMGYANLNANQLIGMRLQGVSIEFIKNLEGLGYANLTAGQLISMRMQTVSIEFIRNLQAQGHKSLSADDIIGMRNRSNN
ncbi:MAG TPA: M56 family metallopeptidase [Pyrinomonadaceae bacterium]|nr:M56 family metallopeptidase [Pyrinomonadaceae bacterium]